MYLNLKNDESFLYEKIYKALKEKIINGDIMAYDKLPSIRNLSKDINVSVNTIKKAYYKLEEEGYVEAEDKSGFYVKKIDDLIVLDKRENFKESDYIKVYKYDFGISGVDYENFPYKIMQKYMKEAIDKKDIKILDKGSFKGYKPLRAAISTYLKSARNIDISYSNIIISSSTEHLFTLVKMLLNDQSLYAFENPGYAFGNKFFTFDLENPIPLDMDKDGVRIDKISDFKSICVFVTPFHQFPMGTVMSIQRRVELLNWASKSENRYIIEDDYDCEFKFRGFPIESLKSMDKNSDVIYFGSFSKLLAPSLRISYMVLPDKLLKKYEENFKDLSNTVSNFLQKALASFIESGEFEKHINRMKNIYYKKFELIVRKIGEINEIKFISKPNSLILPIEIDESVDIGKFMSLLEKNSIRIIPLSRFLFNKKSSLDCFFILGFANLSEKEIIEGFEIIKDIISKSKKNRI
ncbi:PLP-dependent aminotransferase family protein [Anaerococcus porci]|uniref:MocR-like pyridoxine biosynthesis transcription factor PdxR n=1 Tax=Anaerococcus porci TaxID=2652269 RepID=UPI002A763EA7|nr:PLP-dependent aminotransferase family protein [Anaerococcus porci]MDY3006416.1 PLP-dependent aminotransferase family protein [Anaerococcus porci]